MWKRGTQSSFSVEATETQSALVEVEVSSSKSTMLTLIGSHPTLGSPIHHDLDASKRAKEANLSGQTAHSTSTRSLRSSRDKETAVVAGEASLAMTSAEEHHSEVCTESIPRSTHSPPFSIASSSSSISTINTTSARAQSSAAGSTHPPPAASSSLVLPPRATRFSRRITSELSSHYYPLGPSHLEHAYTLAWEDLRTATISAAVRLGYQPIRPHASVEQRAAALSTKPTLQMILDAKFPDVERARRKVNEADRILQEALGRGETWDNTPPPWPELDEDFFADEKPIPSFIFEKRSGSSTEKGKGKAVDNGQVEVPVSLSFESVAEALEGRSRGKRKTIQGYDDADNVNAATSGSSTPKRRSREDDDPKTQTSSSSHRHGQDESSAALHHLDSNSPPRRREGLRPRKRLQAGKR